MTNAQKLVAEVMRSESTQYNNFDGNKVVDWLEANEELWLSFYFADLNYPLLVLYQLRGGRYHADTLYLRVENLEDAEAICLVAETEWNADEVEIVEEEKRQELKYYCKDPLIRIFWD